MTSHTPLDTDNWQYVDNYFKNPGDYSYDKHYAFDHHYRFSLKKACSDYVVSNKKCILRRFIKYDMNMKPYLIPLLCNCCTDRNRSTKKRDYQRPRNTGCN